MSRAAFLSVVALLALAVPGAAQSVRSSAIDAGDVATVVLQLPAVDADSVHYQLELDADFRPFIPTEGTVARSGDTFILALSFATPSRLPAGDVLAGELRLFLPGREPTSRDIVVRVKERREFTFLLDADETQIEPDGVTRIPYRIHNLGNRPDTIFVQATATNGWALRNAPRLVVAPGDSVYGGLEVAAPVSVDPGDRQLVALTARSGDRVQTRTVNLVVVSPSGWLGGLAHVPSTLFIGQALGESPATVAALSGSGRVAPDTDVRVDFRHAEAGIIDPALQRQLAGARLRVALMRPDLQVAVGDVYTPRSTVTGSLRQARGVDLAVDPAGPFAAGVFVAVPAGLGGDIRGGHIVQANGSMESRYGEIGLLMGDMVQPGAGTAPTTRSSGAGLRWSHVRGAHSGTAEATFVRLQADTLQRSGPALEVNYQFETDRFSARLRGRRVPGAATATGGQGNETAASLSAQILPAIHAVAWAFTSEQEPLGMGSRSESYSANIGLRGRLSRTQLQLAATASGRTADLALVSGPTQSFTFERRTARGEASYVRGALSFSADAEAGLSRELGREGPYRAVGSSARWYGAGRAAWARVSRSLRPGDITSTTFQVGGRLEAGPVALSGGLNQSISGGMTTGSFWSSTEVDVLRNLTFQVGASARPSLDWEDWSFSLGLRRRLNLPMPLARHPDLHGIVFDDANANGIRDPGERALEGVALSLGYIETTTDREGRFAFRDATGMPVRIRNDRLPLGYVIPSNVVLPTRGESMIPLVRTATLHLELFLDRDGDARRDRAESPGAGVVVVLTDERGRKRSATADLEGHVRVSGLAPGTYAVTARPPSAADRAVEAQVLMEVELAPGAEARHTLAVPLRGRTIRMGGEEGGVPLFR